MMRIGSGDASTGHCMSEVNDSIHIRSFLESEDPLSDAAIARLTSHREEDLHVDYKETFNAQDEVHWLGITVDAMAFANTMGGYIVFGVTDGEFRVVGLPDDVVAKLTNTNMIIQKLSRYVLPPFALLRSKKYETQDGRTIVVLYIPESKGKTHICVKDASYTYPSGAMKVVIHAGAVFVRRSGTNHVVEPDDLEFIVNRRIEHYRESILDKICKVVQAPPDHAILVFDPKPTGADGRAYAISDSPDAIPVKGMSFTIVPTTDNEEVWGWISLSKKDPSFRPSESRLWQLYANRHESRFAMEQLAGLVRFSLLSEMPVFYWLRSMSSEHIKPLLAGVFSETKSQFIRSHVLRVSAFLGRTFHGAMLNRFGEAQQWAGLRSRRGADPHDLFHPELVRELGPETTEKELTRLALDLSNGRDVIAKTRAHAMDCRLYARCDKYLGA